MAKHSNVYYIRDKDGNYTPCKNAVGVRNKLGADLFHNKSMVFEGSTGVRVCSVNEIDGVLNKYKDHADGFMEVVKKAVDTYGLSPRYTKPEVKKVELFPPDERRKLAKTLFQTGKSWFFRYPLETGPELYTIEKEFLKTGVNSPLYTPCNGWMIPLSILPLDRFDKPDFNLYEYIQSRYETMIADPMAWADPSVAEFLGRREEADAHNLPIRQAREATNRERAEQRETARLEREERALTEYNTAISSAEQTILARGVVSNKDVNGKSLILQLFRENGITLPLKTQGWVKASLAEIYHSADYGWTYRYYGKPSTVIKGYIGELATAVEAKYRQMEVEKKPAGAEQPKGKPSILNTLEDKKKEIASQGRTSPTTKKEQPDL